MKKNHIVLICVCAVFLLINISLIIAHQGVKHKLANLDEIKEQELEKRLVVERKNIQKDLEEKHQADIVSYQAMAKRLEIEKAKVKAAESNIKEIAKDKKKDSPEPAKAVETTETKRKRRRRRKR